MADNWTINFFIGSCNHSISFPVDTALFVAIMSSLELLLDILSRTANNIGNNYLVKVREPLMSLHR
jgi:hypothetical protein